jgi:hypothetical protein
MQLPTYLIVAAIEIYILLIIANLVLLFYVRRQRNLARRQQEKLQHIVGELEQLTLPPSSTKAADEQAYRHHIEAQLTATRHHYTQVTPDGDLSSAPTADQSAASKALWLRHKFLEAERAAIENGAEPHQIGWGIFSDQLLPLWNDASQSPHKVELEEASADNTELEEYKQRVNNLEKFKQLFFTMEQQWEAADKQAQAYYQQLLAFGQGVENNQLFMELLEGYRHVYGDLTHSFEAGRSNFSPSAESATPLTVQVSRINTQSSEEIIRLRNVAADQHRTINQLHKKLEEAVTAEAKELVIQELKHQLQRQTRFVNESETCIQQLESELVTASEKINQQQQALLNATEAQIELDRAKELLEQFAEESKHFVADIFELETANDQLQSALTTTEPTANNHEDKALVEVLQAELAALKKQYLELETRYLDLKLGTR